MRRPHFEPPHHESRSGLVAPVRLDPRGLRGPTPEQARGSGWRRTGHGWYVPSMVDRALPEQRILEASSHLPAYGGVTGWAALRWCGARWFDGMGSSGREEQPVWLATSCADIRPQAGVEVCAEGLDPRDLVVVDGVRVTTPVRSVCFEMRYAGTPRAAARSLDLAAFSDAVSLDEVAAYTIGCLSGWTGAPVCRGALPLADENCWSPQEFDMRTTWHHDGGFPRPLCNVPIFDNDGNHIGTPDLLDPDAGIAGEYDGRHHLELTQRSHDITREAAFRAVGLEYVTMLASDLHDNRPFLLRLTGAYARARYEPESVRRWVLAQPTWWVDTSTVAARRSLTDHQRRLWLRRQVA